jgi:propanol-preferring alcohol dehydrogenase
MKALVLHEWSAPLSLESVPDPEPGPNDVVLRVHANAPDQLDVTVRAGRQPDAKLPLILGHEVAGEIVALGSHVDRWRTGDRVIPYTYLTCGNCRFCHRGRETLCRNLTGYIGVHADGGYAEFVSVPARNLVAIPDGVSYVEATAIPNAIATPLRAIKGRAGVRAGDDVVIVGACGGVGIHGVQIAKYCGARVIAVDIDDARLEEAKKLGADLIVNGEKEDFSRAVMDFTDGKGAEAVMEFVAMDATMQKSFDSLATAGSLIFVGAQPGSTFSPNPVKFVMDEFVVTGSRHVNRAELAEAAAWLADGKVKPIISDTYPLAEGEAALTAVAENRVLGRSVILPGA